MARNELSPNLQLPVPATQNETIIRRMKTSAERLTDLFLRLMTRQPVVRRRRLSTPRVAAMIQLLESRQTLSAARRRQSAAVSVEMLELRTLLSATTFTVTNTNDGGAGSLRAAINQANADNASDTIKFASNLSGSTIHLTSGELGITGSMTITGLGASQLTIDGGWDRIAGDAIGSRIVDITSTTANVTITGLTLIHGNGQFANGGGAIANEGHLTLANDTISMNSAAFGGGVYNNGTWTSTNDTISGNSADVGDVLVDGGGVFNGGTWTSTNDIISGNTAAYGGGGVWNEGIWMSTNDTITGNLATNYGGGVYNEYSSIWTSTNDAISGNSALYSGGALFNHGTWKSTYDSITGNFATDDSGGGVYNHVGGVCTSASDTIAGNIAANNGGGVYNYAGVWTSTNDTIAGNTATNNGGGVYNDSQYFALNTIISGNRNGDLTGTISNTTPSNLIGGNVVQILATDANGKPVLANNGGTTKTIALVSGSPAIDKALPLTTLTQNLAAGATTISVANGTFLAVGQQLKIDNDIVTVTLITVTNQSSTTITVTRAAGGGTSHVSGAAIKLAYDQTGALRTANDIGAVEKVAAPAAINHAPQGTAKTVTTLEDAAYVFKTTDFGFTDPNNAPANALLSAKISTLPTAGSLTDNGVAVAVGAHIAVVDIAAGKLKFTPVTNKNGSAYSSFKFQVQDNGGTANGGVDTDPTPRTMTISVTSVNNAPVGTAKTVSTLEDTGYVFKTTDFGFTDPNDVPANTLSSVKISTLPTVGSLTDNGIAVAFGAHVPVADIAAGKLKFTPATNKYGSAYSSFKFQVQDNGGTANGGVDTDPTARAMTISVTSVNDAPVGTAKTVATLEDTAYVFKTTDFGFTDSNDVPANTLLSVKISTLPTVGSLTDNGTAMTVGAHIAVADIAAGKLKFTPAPNKNGVAYTSFKFQVQDNGGTANGGIDTDPTGRAMTISVTSVNDAPMGTAKTVSMTRNTSYVYKITDFGFTDPKDSPGNTLLSVKITTLPALGKLTDNGVAVAAGAHITVADITSGKLKYTPATNGFGTAYSSFTFQVQDNGGTANGGIDTDLTARNLTISVS